MNEKKEHAQIINTDTLDTFGIVNINGSKYAIDIAYIMHAQSVTNETCISFRDRPLGIHTLNNTNSNEMHFALICNKHDVWKAIGIDQLLGSEKGARIGADQRIIKMQNGELCGNLEKIFF